MSATSPDPEKKDFFTWLRPLPMKLAECTCGHLKYTHRYLGGKFACAAPACLCIEYTETADAKA